MKLMTLLKFNVQQEIRNLSGLCTPLVFFLMINAFYPLGLKASSSQLLEISPMICWITVLLSTFLIAESFFQQEFYWGVFEQWLLSQTGLFVLVSTKLLIKWVFAIFPMIIAAFVINLIYGQNTNKALLLFGSLLLGSPILLLISILMSAAGLSVSMNSGLLALLTLPITLPVFIFGSGIVFSASPLFSLYMLSALFILSLITIPLCICYLIRVSLE